MNNFDYVMYIFCGHRRIQRQREDAVVDSFGTREVAASISEVVTIEGMQMDRNEMDARANVSFFELIDELGAVDRQFMQVETNCIEMIGMIPIRMRKRSFECVESGKCLIIHARKPLSHADEAGAVAADVFLVRR
jgi:hypothetical protein